MKSRRPLNLNIGKKGGNKVVDEGANHEIGGNEDVEEKLLHESDHWKIGRRFMGDKELMDIAVKVMLNLNDHRQQPFSARHFWILTQVFPTVATTKLASVYQAFNNDTEQAIRYLLAEKDVDEQLAREEVQNDKNDEEARTSSQFLPYSIEHILK